MKFFDRLKGKAAIRGTADHFGETPEQVRADMQEAIAAAWASDDDPAAKALREELFPDGQPSPEEFISVLAAYTKKQRKNFQYSDK